MIDGVVTSVGEVYNNSFLFHFYFDADGITKIEKETKRKGIELYWERNPNHEEFLKEKQVRDEIKVKKKADAEYFNKICSIINKYRGNQSDMMIKMISGKQDQDLIKAMKTFESIINKVKKLEQKRDKMLETM